MRGTSTAGAARLIAMLAAILPAATRAQGSTPPPTHLEALAFDSARGRLVLFGGSRQAAGGGAWADGGDTWEWEPAAGWRLGVGADAGPGPRRAHGMTYDPERRAVLLVGGVRARPDGGQGDELLRDAWSYDGRRWRREADIPPLSTPRIVYDSRRRAMLLAGFRSEQSSARWLVLYRRSGGQWRLVDSAGPMATGPLGVAYDARRSVLVVPALADSVPGVWEWDGRAWRRDAAPGPSRRTRYGLAFDGGAGRLVLVGGRGEAPRELLDDAWSWDGERWQALPPAAGPGPRASATLLGAPTHPRLLLLYGGVSSGGIVNELWLLDAGGWRRWTPPPG